MISIFFTVIVVTCGFIIYMLYRDKRSKSEKDDSYCSVNLYVKTSSVYNHDLAVIPDISKQMRFHSYKVRGKNPLTNRLKTCVVVALSGTPENEIALKSGFLEPYTVTLDSQSMSERPPSQEQLKYAKNLNIAIPPDCSCADASRLISKQLDEDTNDLVTNGLMTFAAAHGFCLSPYSGVFSSVCNTMNSLDTRDSLAFLAYLIYCVANSLPIENLDDSKYRNVFYSFSETYIDDEKVNECATFNDTQIRHLLEKKHFDERNKKKAWLFHLILDFIAENIPKS